MIAIAVKTNRRGRPLDWTLREAIVRLAGEGQNHSAIGRALEVHRNTVRKYAPRNNRPPDSH